MADERSDVVLTICPPWGEPSVPVGIAYVGAYLQSRGIPVAYIDLNQRAHARTTDEHRGLWEIPSLDVWMFEHAFEDGLLAEDILDSAEALAEAGPRIVGFSVNQANLQYTYRVMRELRKRSPETVIVAGGPGVFIKEERDRIPAGLVDYFVVGEGEVAAYELFRRLLDGEKPEDVPGVLAAGGSEFIPVKPVKSLDELPYPTYEGFDLSLYPDSQTMSLVMSRGCFCRCAFCGDWAFWPKYRFRSAENILAEVREIHERYGTVNFRVNDLSLNGDIGQLARFADLLIDFGLKIQWYGSVVVRPEMDPALLAKLAASGCVMLNVGLESGSAAVLKRMRKAFTPDMVERFMRDCTDAGIKVTLSLMVGFPGETEQDLEQTVAFLERNRDRIDCVTSASICFIKPSSLLSESPEDFGIELYDRHTWITWTDSERGNYARRLRSMDRLLEAMRESEIPLDGNVYGYKTDQPEEFIIWRLREGPLEVVFHRGAVRLLWDGLDLLESGGIHLYAYTGVDHNSVRDYLWEEAVNEPGRVVVDGVPREPGEDGAGNIALRFEMMLGTDGLLLRAFARTGADGARIQSFMQIPLVFEYGRIADSGGKAVRREDFADRRPLHRALAFTPLTDRRLPHIAMRAGGACMPTGPYFDSIHASAGGEGWETSNLWVAQRIVKRPVPTGDWIQIGELSLSFHGDRKRAARQAATLRGTVPVLRSGGLSVFFDNDAFQVVRKGYSLTQEPGVQIDLDLERDLLLPCDIQWETPRISGRALVVSGRPRSGPYKDGLRITHKIQAVSRGRLIWRVVLEADGEIAFGHLSAFATPADPGQGFSVPDRDAPFPVVENSDRMMNLEGGCAGFPTFGRASCGLYLTADRVASLQIPFLNPGDHVNGPAFLPAALAQPGLEPRMIFHTGRHGGVFHKGKTELAWTMAVPSTQWGRRRFLRRRPGSVKVRSGRLACIFTDGALRLFRNDLEITALGGIAFFFPDGKEKRTTSGLGWKTIRKTRSLIKARAVLNGRELTFNARIKRGTVDLSLEGAPADTGIVLVFPQIAEAEIQGTPDQSRAVLVRLGTDLTLRVSGRRGESVHVHREKASVRSGTEVTENLVVEAAPADALSGEGKVGFVLELSAGDSRPRANRS